MPDFIKTPLGLAVLAMGFTVSGAMITANLDVARNTTGGAVRVEALEKRVDSLAADFSDYRRGALTGNQFNEFRIANDKRLDEVREDIKSLETDLRVWRPAGAR